MDTKTPTIGAAVITSDGHLYGRVAALAGDCFKVDKPMDVDEWLGMDVVSGVDQDVRLSLSRVQLEGDPEGIEHLGFHVHHAN